MQIGVSNPNVPIFPPRVCTLVLFHYYIVLAPQLNTIYIYYIYIYIYIYKVNRKCSFQKILSNLYTSIKYGGLHVVQSRI